MGSLFRLALGGILANGSEPSLQTRKSIGLGFLLGVLASFVVTLSAFTKPRKRRPESISPQNKLEQPQAAVPSAPITLLSSQDNPPNGSGDQPCQCCHHKTPVWKIALEITSGLVGVGLLIANAYLWDATNQQAINTKKAFESVKQAQITIDNIRWRVREVRKVRTAIEKRCVNKGKERICFEIDYKNDGQSAATGTHVVTHVLSPALIDHAEETIKNLPIKPFNVDGQHAMSSGIHQWDTESVEEICGSTTSIGCIPPDDADAMIKANKPLYVYGYIQYQDIFKYDHVTRFCSVQPPDTICTSTPGGCFWPCDFGNTFDKKSDILATKN